MGVVERVALQQNTPKLPFKNSALAAAFGRGAARQLVRAAVQLAAPRLDLLALGPGDLGGRLMNRHQWRCECHQESEQSGDDGDDPGASYRLRWHKERW